MALYRRGTTWWYKFKFRGLEIRESAHTSSRTVELKAERARRNELDEGASSIKTVKPLLFSKAAKDWLDLKAPHWQLATRASEGYNVGHLLPYFGRKLLTDISANDIARYQAKRIEGGASPRTVNMEVGSLRAVLRKHRLWANLQPDVTPLTARTDIGRALSEDEVTKLLHAARESQSKSLHIAILLSLRTGLRNKELRMLRWSMVDLVDGALIVGVSKTKGGEGRVVPLSPAALAALREWRRNFLEPHPEHFVFPTERISGTGPRRTSDGVDPTRPIGSWKTAFHTALRTSGVKCRWHDLRHTTASRLGEGGVPEQTLLALCGWMSRKMLERYSHTRMEAKRVAVDALDGIPDSGGGTNVGTVQ
jgi:integrase